MQFPHICVLCNVNLLQDVCSWRVGVFLDVVNEASLYNQSHRQIGTAVTQSVPDTFSQFATSY